LLHPPKRGHPSRVFPLLPDIYRRSTALQREEALVDAPLVFWPCRAPNSRTLLVSSDVPGPPPFLPQVASFPSSEIPRSHQALFNIVESPPVWHISVFFHPVFDPFLRANLVGRSVCLISCCRSKRSELDVVSPLPAILWPFPTFGPRKAPFPSRGQQVLFSRASSPPHNI